MQRKSMIGASMVAICLLAGAMAVKAQDEVKGMITTRAGDNIVVKGDAGTTTVHITDQTITKDDTGLFGLGTKKLDATVLIPGLKVKVKGAPDSEGKYVATKITVDGDDMETAEMVQAGLTPTAEQVAANVQKLEQHSDELAKHSQEIQAAHQNITINKDNIANNRSSIDQNIQNIASNTNRFSALDDYDVKGSTTIKFKPGASRLAAEDEEQLKQLAQTAQGLPGVLVEVTGYADSSGDARMNTALSERRADEVVTFLVQQCNIPRRLIAAPGAMGEYGSVASNETKEGRAENRRVEVKLLVNKGISGGGQ